MKTYYASVLRLIIDRFLISSLCTTRISVRGWHHKQNHPVKSQQPLSTLQMKPNLLQTVTEASEPSEKMNMMRLLDSIEPMRSNSVLWLAQKLWPLYALLKRRKLDLRISRRTEDAFRMVERSPTLICPNHSAYDDPGVMFILSTKVSQQFYFLAARELFGDRKLKYARGLQAIGVYSVERGAADSNAFKATKQLLTTGNSKIVIFPEGEVTHQNNHLIDFETGAEYIGLSACEELKKRKSEQNIYILPMSLRYEYSKQNKVALEDAIKKIEAALDYEHDSKNLSKRVKAAFSQLLDRYGFPIDSASPDEIEHRITALRRALLSDVQLFLGATTNDSLSDVHKIHLLRNKFAQKSWCYEKKALIHFPCKQCPSRQDRTNYDKLIFATHLLAIGNHSFDHELSTEELAELLTILQCELFGKSTLERPDIVHVDATVPIDLRDYVSTFERDKRHGINDLKNEIAKRISNCLHIPKLSRTDDDI